MNCLVCNKETNSKNVCSHRCRLDFEYLEYIKRWKAGLDTGIKGGTNLSNHIRRYIFTKYNSKCCECSWSKVNPHSGKIPLEVDHIDGNYKNNAEENLRLLCPSCHALTATYKGANKGGRDRTKYKSRY